MALIPRLTGQLKAMYEWAAENLHVVETTPLRHGGPPAAVRQLAAA
jgi:hypothetical protein